MTRRPTWVSMAALGASVAMAASLSAPALAQSPSAAAPQPDEQPPALTADITSYPSYGGGVDCENATFNGLPYTGNLKSIEAPDAQTVVFTFCNPNVAFLEQAAFASLQIDDAQYLIDHMGDKSILSEPNGTGPYKLKQWDRGNRLVLEANADYWGEDKALTPNVEFRWSDQAAGRLNELLSGTVDGIDNVGADDMETIETTDGLTLYPRDDALNIFYIGLNNRIEPFDDVRVRQAIAMGIDRQRIVDNFYPVGSSVADFWTPCAVEFGCEGEPYHAYDLEKAKALLAEAGFPDGFQTTIALREAVRTYLPDPPVVAQEIQAQLKANLNIDAQIEVQESGTFLTNAATGQLGMYLLGWNADYPDMTNFLDIFFASGQRFGDLIPELVEALKTGAQSADPAVRKQAYTDANNIIREQVPAVVMIHGASAAAFKSDVEGAHSSPLGNEQFAVMKPGDRDTLVWMQNAQPLSLYCGDESDGETLRACEQIKEALYAYEVAGTEVEPALAESCTANDDLTVWTCTLREGVTFHDGATLDATDVIVSYAAQWDALSPQHIGNSGVFEYWPALVGGGFLNG